MTNILDSLKKDLDRHIDKEYKEGVLRFFKQDVKIVGVRLNTVRGIARKYFREIRPQGKGKVFSLCRELLKTGVSEYATVALEWAVRLRKDHQEQDFGLFESWLKKYINHWGTCDDLCTHIINPLIQEYPTLIPRVKAWTSSRNIWVRRGSAVSFVTTRRQFYTEENLRHVFQVAETLMMDREDLVQKGYGWMLKVASTASPAAQKAVFQFVMSHKDRMPRTALRYAIEKMPGPMRKRAMG